MSFEKQWNISFDRAATELDASLQVVVDGQVQCGIGLISTFYFEDGDVLEVRTRLVEAIERYLGAIGDQLIWGGDPKNGRVRRVKGTQILNVRQWYTRLGPQDEFSPVFHGGHNHQDASPYHLIALAEKLRPGQLSSLTFSVPLSWASDKPPGSYLQLILGVCQDLQPIHGHAGLAIYLHVNEIGNGAPMPYAVALVSRFRGLELDYGYIYTNRLSKMQKIKGLNWLTILAPDWVERAVGSPDKSALETALGPECPVHTYPGGVVIQAGPHPRFGDVNRQEPMVEYERVAQVLKPIRTFEIGSLARFSGFDEDRTSDWLKRFDD